VFGHGCKSSVFETRRQPTDGGESTNDEPSYNLVWKVCMSREVSAQLATDSCAIALNAICQCFGPY
jgi:hypothetical protein